MRKHHHRKRFARHALRECQVGRDLQSIRRFVADRLHVRERLSRQFLASLILEREFVRFPVEQIHLSRFCVSGGIDEPDLLVQRTRRDIEVRPVQFLLDPLVVRLRRICRGNSAAHGPRHIHGGGRLSGNLRKDGAPKSTFLSGSESTGSIFPVAGLNSTRALRSTSSPLFVSR